MSITDSPIAFRGTGLKRCCSQHSLHSTAFLTIRQAFRTSVALSRDLSGRLASSGVAVTCKGQGSDPQVTRRETTIRRC